MNGASADALELYSLPAPRRWLSPTRLHHNALAGASDDGGAPDEAPVGRKAEGSSSHRREEEEEEDARRTHALATHAAEGARRRPPSQSSTDVLMARVLGAQPGITARLCPGMPYIEKPGGVRETSQRLVEERTVRRERRARQAALEAALVALNARSLVADARRHEAERAFVLCPEGTPLRCAANEAKKLLTSSFGFEKGIGEENGKLRSVGSRSHKTPAGGSTGLVRLRRRAEQGACADDAARAATCPPAHNNFDLSDSQECPTGVAASGDHHHQQPPPSHTSSPDQAGAGTTALRHSERRSRKKRYYGESLKPRPYSNRSVAEVDKRRQQHLATAGPWNDSIAVSPPRAGKAAAIDESTYARRGDDETTAYSDADRGLLVPGELPKAPTPDVHEVLRTIASKGVHAVKPTNALTQTVCALHVYGTATVRSRRLAEVQPALERVILPRHLTAAQRAAAREQLRIAQQRQQEQQMMHRTFEGVPVAEPPPGHFDEEVASPERDGASNGRAPRGGLLANHAAPAIDGEHSGTDSDEQFDKELLQPARTASSAPSVFGRGAPNLLEQCAASDAAVVGHHEDCKHAVPDWSDSAAEGEMQQQMLREQQLEGQHDAAPNPPPSTGLWAAQHRSPCRNLGDFFGVAAPRPTCSAVSQEEENQQGVTSGGDSKDEDTTGSEHPPEKPEVLSSLLCLQRGGRAFQCRLRLALQKTHHGGALALVQRAGRGSRVRAQLRCAAVFACAEAVECAMPSARSSAAHRERSSEPTEASNAAKDLQAADAPVEERGVLSSDAPGKDASPARSHHSYASDDFIEGDDDDVDVVVGNAGLASSCVSTLSPQAARDHIAVEDVTSCAAGAGASGDVFDGGMKRKDKDDDDDDDDDDDEYAEEYADDDFEGEASDDAENADEELMADYASQLAQALAKKRPASRSHGEGAEQQQQQHRPSSATKTEGDAPFLSGAAPEGVAVPDVFAFEGDVPLHRDGGGMRPNSAGGASDELIASVGSDVLGWPLMRRPDAPAQGSAGQRQRQRWNPRDAAASDRDVPYTPQQQRRPTSRASTDQRQSRSATPLSSAAPSDLNPEGMPFFIGERRRSDGGTVDTEDPSEVKKPQSSKPEKAGKDRRKHRERVQSGSSKKNGAPPSSLEDQVVPAEVDGFSELRGVGADEDRFEIIDVGPSARRSSSQQEKTRRKKKKNKKDKKKHARRPQPSETSSDGDDVGVGVDPMRFEDDDVFGPAAVTVGARRHR